MERLRVKLAEVGVKTEKELKPISTKIVLKDEIIEEYIKPLFGKTLDDTLKLISSAPHFIPDISRTQKNIERYAKKSPLYHLIPKVYTKEGHIIGSFSNQEELQNINKHIKNL